MKKIIIIVTLISASFNGNSQHNYDNQNVIYSNNGKVGIGTDTPEKELDVRGSLKVHSDSPGLTTSDIFELYALDNPSIILRSGSGTNERLQFALADCNGCFNPTAKPGDAVIRNLGWSHDLILAMTNTNNDGTSNIRIIDSYNQDTFIVYNNGKVSIGTENTPTISGTEDISSYKLFVKGGILTEEVRVKTDWADYVFDPEYNLQSLPEVEAFIKLNKHLPNMPSGKQIKENGLELGNIIKIQQEKIEELTLYTIQQQKEIQQLREQNSQIEKQAKEIEELKNLVQGLLESKN